MSSRARRISAATPVSAFAGGGDARAPMSIGGHGDLAMTHVGGSMDVAEHHARLAALEREAFAKGYEQGERAGAEAAAQRGEAILRRLAQTIEELTTLRAEMIHRTERQMVQLALAIAKRVVHREVSLDHDLLI